MGAGIRLGGVDSWNYGRVQTVPIKGSIWAKTEKQSSGVETWRCKQVVLDAASALLFPELGS